jgi:hypothetical protein
LWSGNLIRAQVVSQFGWMDAGDAVLNFGGGQRITIEGMTLNN